jgi:hypothetical protein
MNPEILRQIAALQIRDQRARATRDRVARTLAKALRGGNLGVVESDGFVAPVIPDYVDGSFAHAEAQVGVPAARTAA